MRNQPRNVLGDEQMWAGMIPGLAFFYYLLGLLTVPVELFLRRNFGERYFTRMNFVGGLLILALWIVASKFIGFFGFLNPFSWFEKETDFSQFPSLLPKITKWYIYIGLCHFAYMWWRDITGKPVHSYSAGRSWLRPIGKALIFVLNLFLNNLVRLIFLLLPKADKKRLPSILPVLRDVDTFTERFVEPAVLLFGAWFFFQIEQYTVGWWLIFSAMALNLYTGLRHQAERGVFLDYRDMLIDMQLYRDSSSSKARSRNDKVAQETAREVEKNPEVFSIIKAHNPTLAHAMEQISPKLKAMANQSRNAAFDEESTPEIQPA